MSTADAEAGAMETETSAPTPMKRTGTIKATRASRPTSAEDDNADRNQKLLLALLIFGGIAAFTIFILGTLDLNKKTSSGPGEGAGGEEENPTLPPALQSYFVSLRFSNDYNGFGSVAARHEFGKTIARLVAEQLNAPNRVRVHDIREGSTIVDLQILPPPEGSTGQKNAVELALDLDGLLKNPTSTLRSSPSFSTFESEDTGGGSQTPPPATVEPTQAGETKSACASEPNAAVANSQTIGSGCAGTVHGGGCSFRCQAGYELTSLVEPLCNDGTWIRVPACVPSDCVPATIVNGGATPQRGVTGEQTTYSCNNGYTLVGDAVATCMPNHQWSDNATHPRECVANPCSPDLQAPTDGLVSSTKGSFGDVRTYECLAGFSLNGNATTTCQANGQWSNPAPLCEAAGCTSTPAVNDSENTCGNVDHGARCTALTCAAGFSMVGDKPLCQFGSYEELPTCRPNACVNNPPIANANYTVVNCSNTDVGNQCSVPCVRGYEVQGLPVNATCEVGGWEEPLPTCGPKACPQLGLNPNSRTLENTTQGATGASVTVVCNSGFDMLPSGTTRVIRCVPNPDDPDWTPAPPQCFPKPCPALVRPLNGTLTLVPTYNTERGATIDPAQGRFGDVATYGCNTGFSLNGSSPVRSCVLGAGTDAVWSPALAAPSCSPNPCVDAIFLNNTTPGSPSCVGTRHAKICPVECLKGFRLTGPPPRCWLGVWQGNSRCEYVPTTTKPPKPPATTTKDSGIFGFLSDDPTTSGAIALGVGLTCLLGFTGCCCMICKNMKNARRVSKRIG